MSAPAFLPGEFRWCEDAGARFSVRDDLASAFADAGYGLEGDGALRVSTLVGRKPLFELPTSQGDFVVRRFSHGGLLRFATGERFLDPDRPFRELALAHDLRAAGVPTPEVVAARARRASGFGWQLDLVSCRIEGTSDLGALLGAARRGEIDPRSLRCAWEPFGELVAALHARGVLHADLTPNNVLVDRASLARSEPKLYVLDLDRARVVDAVGDDERRANLRRLYRFVARREERDGGALSRSDYARFLRGMRLPRGAWKDDWRAVLDAHARKERWHKAGWKLEESFGKRRDVRE